MAFNPFRSRWSYSLRTLFVLVTIFGCGMGWLDSQVMMVQRRNNALQRMNATVVTDDQWSTEIFWTLRGRGHLLKFKPRLPFWRKWLGDNEHIHTISLPLGATAADMQEIEILFPEIESWRRRMPSPPDEVYDRNFEPIKRS